MEEESKSERMFSGWAIVSLFLFLIGIFAIICFTTILPSMDSYRKTIGLFLFIKYFAIFGLLAFPLSFIAGGIASAKGNGKYAKWLLRAILILLIWLIAYNIWPPISSSKEKAIRISCASDLKKIGLALKQYAIDNNDFFPPQDGAAGLETLRKAGYLDDPKLLVCYSLGSKAKLAEKGMPLTEENVSYRYFGGLSEGSSPDSILAMDKDTNHWNFGNILFVDGHVQSYSGANWASLR